MDEVANLQGMLFQFHKGTIRTVGADKKSVTFTYFNSIKVRLEPGLISLSERLNFDFNSIKVRLERIFAAS